MASYRILSSHAASTLGALAFCAVCLVFAGPADAGPAPPYIETFSDGSLPGSPWTFDSSPEGRIALAPDDTPRTTGTITADLTTSTGGDRLRGNFFACTATTFLVENRFRLGLTNGITAHFFVYESSTSNGTYTLISDEIETVGPGTNFFGASDLTVKLDAGKYYLIGASWAESASYYYQGNHPHALGYAETFGGYTDSLSAPLGSLVGPSWTSLAYYQRLVTVPGTNAVLRLDDEHSGGLMSSNAAVLNLDLQGLAEAALHFRHRECSDGDESSAADGVFLSTNNADYVMILDYDVDDTNWTTYVVDLVAAAASNGLALTDNTYIKFAQYDNNEWPSDGREIDDVMVFSSPDLKLVALTAAPETAAFQGAMVKSFALTNTIVLTGTSNAIAADLQIEYRLYSYSDTSEVVRVERHDWTANVGAWQIAETTTVSQTLSVSTDTNLPGYAYFISAELDCTNGLAELDESNNATSCVVYVNHYSGTAFFGDIQTSITVTNWAPRVAMSPVYHKIDGYGYLNAIYQFTFTGLEVDKNTNTLHYSVASSDTNVLALATPGQMNVRDWSFALTNAVLNKDGLFGDVTLELPDNTGYATTAPMDAVLSNLYPVGTVELDQELFPRNDTTSAVVRFWYPEFYPVRFKTVETILKAGPSPVLSCATDAANEMQYVFRARDNAFWRLGEKPSSPPPSRPLLPHNGQYMGGTNDVAGHVITVGPQGIDTTFTMNGPLGYEPSFPRGVNLIDIAGGSVELKNGAIRYDAVDPDSPAGARSWLATSNATAKVRHYLNCNSGYATNSFTLTKDTVLTGDGGVLCDLGTNGIDLTWGAFDIPSSAGARHNLYVPGTVVNGAVPAKRPEYYLNAARDYTNATVYYSPSSAFLQGRHRYAGLNMDVLFQQVLGNIGDTTLDLDLRSEAAKFYVREGGVNGTLDTTLLAPPPEATTIYGYNIEFDEFGINFIDSESDGQESKCHGRIVLPYPSDVNLTFENMSICGCGDIKDADPTQTNTLELAYWEAKFRPVGIEFNLDPEPTNEVDACSAGDRALWVQTINELSHLDVTPIMNCKFEGDGAIATSYVANAASAVCDGYEFALEHIYLNAYNPAFSPTGFYAVAGDMYLPFFGATPTLLHTRGRSGDVEVLHVLNGEDYEEKTPGAADPDMNGVPLVGGSNPLDDFRNEGKTGGDVTADYLVQARGSFASVIDFHYPVQYDRFSRRFASPVANSYDLLVLHTESQVDRMDTDSVAIDFGLVFDTSSPISLGMIVDMFVDTNEILSSISGAVGDLLGDVSGSVNSLDDYLNVDLSELLWDELDTDIVNSGLAEISNLVSDVMSESYGSIESDIDALITALDFGYMLEPAAQEVADTVTNLFGQFDETLDTFFTTKEALEFLINEQLMQVAQLPGVSELGAADVVESLTNTLSELLEPLTEIAETLTNQMGGVETEILSRYGEVTNEIYTIYNTYYGQYYAALTNEIHGLESYLTNLYQQANGQMTYTELESEVKEYLLRSIFNSDFMQDFGGELSGEMMPLYSFQKEAFNALLDQANLSVLGALEGIEDLLSTELVDLKDLTKVSTAKLTGYGIFSKETFEEIHIDLEATLAIPDDMAIHASLDIKRVHIDSDDSFCAGLMPSNSVDVRITAYDIAINWISEGITAEEIYVGFTLGEVGGVMAPIGFCGGISLVGDIDFETLCLSDIQFGAAVGTVENYIYGAGRGSFQDYTFEGGIYFGTCCDMEPLEKIDPEVAGVLQISSLFGVYGRIEGQVPVYNYGCMFTVGVGAGVGAWYFAEGPTWGGLLTGSFYGELACIVSARGMMTLIGGKSGDDYYFSGNAWVAGGIGDCEPEDWTSASAVWDDGWCYTCVAYLDLQYVQDWTVDYGVDCE